ncbi:MULTISPECIES: adenylosuccinate lyase [Thermodesulfovibrio]|uniref:Adenylosuccinate lyase n=1 Tax=Thermodesulfovibrio yellowstonii (strain ATCC 51303 / DSM 11347 / YP87) TaxID=289376 RepID=B5YJI3_THEYD|nr:MULTISPECIES: adenylosuccinate lyase [Thermodesulfovibrio]ACI20346.1 adenylosuccinate lyase [Thermodesulfovibrio yellowstonii DSM 11347]MDI6864349.1 adenylosuccinate lyase [Thermodesulfovibrio yellowstonii]
MIQRYTRKEMGNIWSDENKFRKWLLVEIAVCEAWAELGKIPEEALREIKEKADFDLKRIDEIEATVKHDVIAFLTAVAEKVGTVSRYIHMGLTSSDVVDTAQALLMKEAGELIMEDLKRIKELFKDKAFQYKDTICMGRSHGVHAEPTSFGLRFALWYEEAGRNIDRLASAIDRISVGKISGAVGTFSNMPPEIEEIALKKLGLKPEPVATQVVQRDRHAEFLSVLALIAAMIEKIAVEIRHLQRTEVLEAEEPFTEGQKGSSAMPHKRNPVGCENLSGLARLVRSNAFTAYENIALWHDRDISHSSVERVIIPDNCILVDYMLNRLYGIIKDLRVYPERMLKNIELSFGLYNSQRVLLALVEKGLTREESYKIVQSNAMRSWKEGIPFMELLLKDEEVRKYLNEDEIKNIFELNYYTRNIDHIYRRVFG